MKILHNGILLVLMMGALQVSSSLCPRGYGTLVKDGIELRCATNAVCPGGGRTKCHRTGSNPGYCCKKRESGKMAGNPFSLENTINNLGRVIKYTLKKNHGFAFWKNLVSTDEKPQTAAYGYKPKNAFTSSACPETATNGYDICLCHGTASVQTPYVRVCMKPTALFTHFISQGTKKHGYALYPDFFLRDNDLQKYDCNCNPINEVTDEVYPPTVNPYDEVYPPTLNPTECITVDGSLADWGVKGLLDDPLIAVPEHFDATLPMYTAGDSSKAQLSTVYWKGQCSTECAAGCGSCANLFFLVLIVPATEIKSPPTGQDTNAWVKFYDFSNSAAVTGNSVSSGSFSWVTNIEGNRVGYEMKAAAVCIESKLSWEIHLQMRPDDTSSIGKGTITTMFTCSDCAAVPTTPALSPSAPSTPGCNTITVDGKLTIGERSL